MDLMEFSHLNVVNKMNVVNVVNVWKSHTFTT